MPVLLLAVVIIALAIGVSSTPIKGDEKKPPEQPPIIPRSNQPTVSVTRGSGKKPPTTKDAGDLARRLGEELGSAVAAFNNSIHSGEDKFLEGTSGDNRTVRETAGPLSQVIGGGSAAALFAAGGFAAVGLYAFPIAVGLFAAIEIARNIEDLIRSEENIRRQREVDYLVGTKQYKAAFELANKNAREGYGGHGFKVLGGIDLLEQSDETQVHLKNGASISVREWLFGDTGAYPPFLRAHAASYNPRTLQDSERWLSETIDGYKVSDILARGDSMVDSLIAQQPWWQTRYSFIWRPKWENIEAIQRAIDTANEPVGSDETPASDGESGRWQKDVRQGEDDTAWSGYDLPGHGGA